MAHQTVVETPEFLRRAADIGLTDKDREDLVSHLALNPEAGVSLGGGLRKVRLARQGGGKSGGYRVLHFFRAPDMPLFLLTVFAKNEKANLSRKEQADLIKLCDLIAQTYGGGKLPKPMTASGKASKTPLPMPRVRKPAPAYIRSTYRNRMSPPSGHALAYLKRSSRAALAWRSERFAAGNRAAGAPKAPPACCWR